jgi:hypothetical protein
MKSRLLLLGMFSITLGIMVVSCDNGTNESTGKRYSIQVNNQAAVSRAITAGDKVELYIHNFEYCEDANNRALILVADGDRDRLV